MTRHRGLRALTVLVVGAALLTGCGSSGASGRAAGAAPRASGAAATESAADLSALPACPAVRHVAPRPDGLPPLQLGCLGDGPAVRLSDLRGTPMVLNVWAAWCPNCVAEVGFFRALHAEAGDKVRFFGVHYKATRAQGVHAAVQDFGIFYPSVHDTDGDKTARALRVVGPPQTFFVTADGRVAFRQSGPITSQKMLDELVQKYLGVTV
ncbi:MAG: TlpA family protein disulfide reductase [Actinomycetes bacterium]